MASYKMKQVSENSQQKMQKELAVLLSSLKEKKSKKILHLVTTGYLCTLLLSVVGKVNNSSPVTLPTHNILNYFTKPDL